MKTLGGKTAVVVGALGWLLALNVLPSTGHAICPEPPDTDGQSRKGIGKRDFPKALRHELNLYGGVYANGLMGMAPLAGVNYSFHFNEDFALQADFAYTKFSSLFAEPVYDYTGYTMIQDFDARVYLGSLVWHPFHGKFMLFQAAIPHFDFYLSLGLGVTDSRSSKGLTYAVGGGIKIFCTPWLSLRIDVQDHIYLQEILAKESLTNNLWLTLGVGFWIPFAT